MFYKNQPFQIWTRFGQPFCICCLFFLLFSNDLSCQKNDTLKLDSLYRLAEQSQGIEKVITLNKIFGIYFPKDIAKSRRIADDCLDLAIKIGDNEAKAIALEIYGEIYMYQGKFDSLFIVTQEIIPLVKDLDNNKYLCSAYGNLGIYYERKASLDSAVHYNIKCLELSREKVKYVTYNNLGRIYQRRGDVNKSLEYLELAMNGAKKYNKKNAEAIICNNLGSLYEGINIQDEAKKLYFRSIDLKKEIGDKRGQLFALLNLALMDGISFEEEDVFLKEGQALAKEVKSEQLLSIFIARDADNLAQQGRVDEGISMVMPRYLMSKENPSFEMPFVVTTLSNLYLENGQYEEALNYANERALLAEQSGGLDDEQAARSLFKSIYEKQGDADKYFEVAKTFYTLQDSINKQVNIDKFAYLEAELDQEQKAKVDLLNQSIADKTKSRNQLAVIGLLLTLLLSSLLYFRNKLIKSQAKVIQSEKESSNILLDKNRLLEEHDELKNRLYTNITHEFRTPLTIIHGVVQQLSNNEEIKNLSKRDADIPKQLNTIQKNGNNLLEMVNNILDLSKLEDNSLEVNMVRGDIVSYFKYLSESFESLVKERNIDFQLDIGEDKIIMDYDPEKIRQIFNNLLSNAFKYTENEDKISLKIRKINESPNSSFLMVEVQDTGAGIPSESLPFIFDRFYQAKDSKSMAGGTGIGLAFCKELVELLGGQISVESQLSKGSTFMIQLPITNQSEVLAKEYSYAERTQINDLKNEADPGKKFKEVVLIIEDNRDVANFIASCLVDKYQCKMAINGKLGVEKALNIIPDLIITDIMMPEMDGYEVCEFLTNNELTSHIPIVMLTAKSGQEAKLTGLATGADDYLLKPFDTKELELKVHNLIGSRAKLRDYFTSSAALRTNPKKANTTDKLFYDKVYNIIESNLANDQFGVEFLAKECLMSRVHLNRKIKAMTDLSANKFIQVVRLKHAFALLKNGGKNVSEVAYETGFASLAYFVKCFREQYNVTPGSLLNS